MRFSRSTHLLMFLSLTLTSKDWFTSQPGDLCYNFSILNDLTQILNCPTWIPDSDSHRRALLDLFLSSDASICSIMAFPPLGILIMLLSQIRLTFYRLYSGMPCFIALLMTIFVLFGMDFIKIGEISHGRISLS